MENPKCNTCRCFWKPDETDIKPSGLFFKTCKRCRNKAKERTKNDYYKKYTKITLIKLKNNKKNIMKRMLIKLKNIIKNIKKITAIKLKNVIKNTKKITPINLKNMLKNIMKRMLIILKNMLKNIMKRMLIKLTNVIKNIKKIINATIIKGLEIVVFVIYLYI